MSDLLGGPSVTHKRTKKDVEAAYYRGFQDGFNVRPNPLAMILRSLWKKHELKKMKREYLRKVKEHRPPQVIGHVTSIEENSEGIVMRGKLDG